VARVELKKRHVMGLFITQLQFWFFLFDRTSTPRIGMNFPLSLVNTTQISVSMGMNMNMYSTLPARNSGSAERSKSGIIMLVCGPMRSGKSTWLINFARNQIAAESKCLIVKYKNDRRHPLATDELLTTYNNETNIPALSCEKSLGALYDTMSQYEVICIDEGQFVSNILNHLIYFT
jgi:predicted AAA+ superfamily ATPase